MRKILLLLFLHTTLASAQNFRQYVDLATKFNKAEINTFLDENNFEADFGDVYRIENGDQIQYFTNIYSHPPYSASWTFLWIYTNNKNIIDEYKNFMSKNKAVKDLEEKKYYYPDYNNFTYDKYYIVNGKKLFLNLEYLKLDPVVNYNNQKKIKYKIMFNVLNRFL